MNSSHIVKLLCCCFSISWFAVSVAGQLPGSSTSQAISPSAGSIIANQPEQAFMPLVPGVTDASQSPNMINVTSDQEIPLQAVSEKLNTVGIPPTISEVVPGDTSQALSQHDPLLQVATPVIPPVDVPQEPSDYTKKIRVIPPDESKMAISPVPGAPKGRQKIHLAGDENAEVVTDQGIEETSDDEASMQAIETRTEQARQDKKHLQIAPPDDGDERIEFQFENTDLLNLISQVSELFNVTFITDDIVDQLPPGSTGGKASGNKITFRTHKTMSKKQAWTLFLSFLDIAGFALVPQPTPRWYRVVALPKGGGEQKIPFPVPAYIGVDPQTLPDDDQLIRFVYFVENGNYDVIFNVVNNLRSISSGLVGLGEAKAFILTDKSYNIRMLMVIVKELDRVSLPQAMSVIKLRRAEAIAVAALFKEIMNKGEAQPLFMPPRKESTALYFPENTQVIPEPRTNSLVLLGTPEAIEKIEDFVHKYVDKDPDIPHSPLFHFDLKYADAKTVEGILNATVKEFGTGTDAGKVGGLRGTDKYFKPVSFISDTNTNRIIMRGEYQDYLMIKELVEKIDEPQPQVAIEVLLLEVDQNKSKALGAQVRSKNNGICGVGPFSGHNVQFQTSGLTPSSGIVERPVIKDTTADPKPVSVPCRLMGQLLDLVKGLPVGNTILTLGADCMGVWGVMRILETFSSLEVVANPFTITSNKQRAVINVGRIRRVVSSTVVTGTNNTIPGFDNFEDGILVEVVPLINSDGMISLEINVSSQRFLEGSTAENTAKNNRKIVTKAIVADREVLAIGGLIQNRTNTNQSKVPVLGDLPLLGWLFKNKSKDNERTNMLILISAQIIDPRIPTAAARFTEHHIDEYYGTLDIMHDAYEHRDPIHNMFFADAPKGVDRRVENHIFDKSQKRTKKMRTFARDMAAAIPEKQAGPIEPIVEPIQHEVSKIQPGTEKIPVPAGKPDNFPVALNNRERRRIKVSLTADSSDNQEAVA